MKQKLSLLLALMFAVNAFGQSQLKNWILGSPDTYYDMTIGTPISKGNVHVPSSFDVKNSIYDSKGRILFYVGNHEIRDGVGRLIDNLDGIPSSFPPHTDDICAELPIVPCIESENSCIKRYYVFYAVSDHNTNQVKLFAKIVTANMNTGIISSRNVLDGNNNRRILATSTPPLGAGPLTWSYSGLAVSKKTYTTSGENQIQCRYLYWIAGDVKKIMLTKIDDINDGISSSSVIFNTLNNPLFQFNPLEADLSHDGRKLVWGASNSNAYSQKYFYLQLNPSGNWDGLTNEVFEIGTSSINTRDLRGVEFTPDGKYLIVSTGGDKSTHGIYYKSLSPIRSTFQFVNGSEKYGASQLELASNGLIYASSALSTYNKYAGLDVTTFTFPHGIISNNPPVLLGNILTLPDQIDGENYDNTLNYYDIIDYEMLIPVNPIVYTHVSNPFNVSGEPLRIAGTWTFKGNNLTNTAVYILDRMNFVMANDAKIVVDDNMELRISSCTFQSAECSEMWKGFEIRGTGKIIIFNSPNTTDKTLIYDAQTGIDVDGTNNAQLSVANAIFNRNLTHIKITNYKALNPSGLDMKNNQFLHTQPLHIYTNSNGLPAPAQYGSTSIELGGTIVNSPYLFLSGNTFEGGDYGILSIGIPFQMNTTAPSTAPNIFKNFTNSASYCMFISMNGNTNEPDIRNAEFTNIQRALYATGQTNLTFANNTISGVKKHAVELYRNTDRRLTLFGNQYQNFMQSCILLNNNAGSTAANETKINIHNETMNNTGFINTLPLTLQGNPTGVTIMEPGVRTKSHYKELRINNNTMTNLAFGIRATMVTGFQKMDKTYNDKYPPLNSRNDLSDFDHNTIITYASYTTPVPANSDYNSGMLLNYNRGLVAAVNTISSNQFTQWRSSGIYADNTQQSLMHKNLITAGRGIGAAFSGLGNDMNCNTFTRGVNGISLQDYRMRSAGQTHGIKLVESRDNSYGKTGKENIELYLYRVAPTPVNITDYINSNQWLMNTSPTTLIEPTPACYPFVNCIRLFGAPDLCGFPSDGQGGGGTKLLYNTPPAPKEDDKLYSWQLGYEYERQQKEEGLTYNTTLSNLIDLEELVVSGQDTPAFLLLSSLQLEDIYIQHYHTVYQHLLNARIERGGVLDTPGIEALTEIAVQHPFDGGPAVYLARAILWQQEGIHYMDRIDRNSGNIGIKLEGGGCSGDITSEFTINLINEEGYTYTQDEVPVSLDDEGYVFIPGTIIAGLPQDLTYSFLLDNGNYPAPEYQTLTQWMDNEDNTVYLCPNSVMGKAPNNSADVQPIKTDVSAQQVSVFPNPAREYVQVNLPIGEYTIRIYDMMGRNIYTKNQTQQAIIATDTYKTGVYLIKITDIKGNLIKTQRVLIKP